MLFQLLGGAVIVSVAQNVFSNELLKKVTAAVPSINPASILNAGATDLKNVVAKGDLAAVILAYNDALTTTFYVAVAMASLSILGSSLIRWKSIKGKNVAAVAA